MKEIHDDEKLLKSQYVPTAEFYSQVIDSLQDYSIFTVDNDLKINSWNSGAKTIFQYDTDEIIGKQFETIFTEEDRAIEAPALEIEIALRDGRAVDNKWHICKDGSKFYAYGLVFPLIGLNGEQLGYVKILRDLTERKKSEDAIKRYIDELEELNTHKESVMAILSHDLRSPLTGILGSADYLRRNHKKMSPEALQEMLDLLYQSTKEELNMLDYLVEWARIKYASEVFTPVSLELSKYVEQVFGSLNKLATLNSIHLHNDIEKNIVVFADQKMLLSILQNIVSNAIKHSKLDGNVSVSAKQKEDNILIEIKDSGKGMSEAIRNNLFRPQVKELSSARKEDKGAGIGLLLVKGFLEKNSGEIWVESTEGEGSTFYFTLPITKPLSMDENMKMIDQSE